MEANNSNSGPASWRGPDGGKDKTYTVSLADGNKQQVHCRVVRVVDGDLMCFDASEEIVFLAPKGCWAFCRLEQDQNCSPQKAPYPDWEKLSKDAEKHNKEKEDAWRRVQPYMPYVYFQYPPKDWWKVTC